MIVDSDQGAGNIELKEGNILGFAAMVLGLNRSILSLGHALWFDLSQPSIACIYQAPTSREAF